MGGKLAITYGEYSRAATYYSKAIEFFDGAPDYYFFRAEAMGKLDLLTRQKEDLEKVLTLDPGHVNARVILQQVSPHHPLVLAVGIPGLKAPLRNVRGNLESTTSKNPYRK